MEFRKKSRMFSCYALSSIPKRYIVTALAFVGCFSLYALRAGLGITVVDMTSEKTIIVGNRTEKIRADYGWSSVQKGYVFSAVALGQFFTFVCCPVVVRLGGVTTFGIATMLAGLISILAPLILQIHLYLFLLTSTVQGLLMGLGTVGVVDTFAHWSPPEERVRLTSIYYMGTMSGIAFGYPLFGFIAYHFGWQAVFYFSGGCGLVWSILWLAYVANDPAHDKYISETERNYLKQKIRHITTEKVSVPWTKILTSVPVWALMNEFFTNSWFLSFLTIYIPLFLKDVYDFDIERIGFFGGLPTIFSMIVIPLYSYLADYLRTNIFSVSKVHKIFILSGNTFSVLTLGFIFLGTNAFWTIVCLCLVKTLHSLSSTSHSIIVIDVAGQYSSVIKSITYSAQGVGRFLNPIVMGYMVQNHTRSQWNSYFLFITSISSFGIIMFYVFGSGELQPWALVTKRNYDAEDDKEEVIIKTLYAPIIPNPGSDYISHRSTIKQQSLTSQTIEMWLFLGAITASSFIYSLSTNQIYEFRRVKECIYANERAPSSVII